MSNLQQPFEILKDEQQIIAEQPSENKLIGMTKYIRGLQIFEVNLKTMMLKHADIKESDVNLEGEVHHQIIVNPDCVYVQAINRQNAAKKAMKIAINNKLVPY